MGLEAVLISGVMSMAVAMAWVGAVVLRREQVTARRAGELVGRGELVGPDLELVAPFSERVLRPVFQQLLRFVARLSPGRNIGRLRRELLVAGSPLGLTPLDFVGLRIIVAVAGTAGALILLYAASSSFLRSLLIAIAAALLFSQLPAFWLHRRMNARRRVVQRALPDALDMLTVCVDAGLGLEGSFQRIGQSWDHALAYEFRRAVVEMGMGMSWREAMRNMVYRTDVRDLSSIVAVLLQAEQLGFSIAETLHAQAEQLRVRRRQRAQEQARSAPFKMLFPMVFFILPATFAVVLGPAIPAILEALSAAV